MCVCVCVCVCVFIQKSKTAKLSAAFLYKTLPFNELTHMVDFPWNVNDTKVVIFTHLTKFKLEFLEKNDKNALMYFIAFLLFIELYFAATL